MACLRLFQQQLADWPIGKPPWGFSYSVGWQFGGGTSGNSCILLADACLACDLLREIINPPHETVF